MSKKKEIPYGPIRLGVKYEDGTKKKVWSIASNEDYVSNLIYEGLLSEEARYKELTRLYKSQLEAKQREFMEYKKDIGLWNVKSILKKLKGMIFQVSFKNRYDE